MKILRMLIVLTMVLGPDLSHSQTDATKFLLSLNYRLWHRTSYQNANFETADVSALFRPASRLTFELGIFSPLQNQNDLKSLLAEYTHQAQPFPFDLQSVRLKLHIDSLRFRSGWFQIHRFALGNFHNNTCRHKYLNFSRYVLHSPLDIERKRSLADWGLLSQGQVGSIPFEGFWLHSLDKDYTLGFRLGRNFSLHRNLNLSPEFNGVFDFRNDADYRLSYAYGQDKTLSVSTLFQYSRCQYHFLLKPFFASNRHRSHPASQIRSGYLRNIEMGFTTPLYRNFINLRLDGILERNDPNYRPNFAYDSDELNDDFWSQGGRLALTSGVLDCDRNPGGELSSLVYNRDNINVRLGESGAEAGIRFQVYARSPDTATGQINIANLGGKYARYQQTGKMPDHTYDDSWLVELEGKTPDQCLEMNVAYWRRWTNIVADPALKEIIIHTWIMGLNWRLDDRAFYRARDRHHQFEPTVFSMFFRIDNCLEDYGNTTARDRGNIFAVALTTPLFELAHWHASLQFLYRKYVPDEHILQRIFPPNNTIRLTLNLQTRY